jgi:hypothetical protein
MSIGAQRALAATRQNDRFWSEGETLFGYGHRFFSAQLGCGQENEPDMR